MNEQDKQAMLEAKDRHVSNLEPSEIGYAPLDFSAGWQAALEYARGKQEPVTLNMFDKVRESAKRLGETADKLLFLTSRMETGYEYPTDPVVAINEQMLEALKIAEAALSDIGDAEREEFDDLAWCEGRAWRDLSIVRKAINAAEAAKGGV